MAETQESAPRRYEAAERRPDETLEAHIIRRAARMRKVQALLAVYQNEPSLDEEYERLLDEEQHLWLGPDDEIIKWGSVRGNGCLR